MADECVILVDNSNLFIEGQKVSAQRKGVHPAAGETKQPGDPSWRINFAELLKLLANGRRIRSAILVGSKPPPNDAVWKMAQQGGFNVITHERDASNREKAVDTELVAQGTLLIATTPAPADLVIASGDRDFLPLVNVAHQQGWAVEMTAFEDSDVEPNGRLRSIMSVRSILQLNRLGTMHLSGPNEPEIRALESLWGHVSPRKVQFSVGKRHRVTGRTRLLCARGRRIDLVGLDILLAPLDQRNGIMRRHRLDQSLAGKLRRESIGGRRIGEAPADMIAAFLAPTATVVVLDAPLGMEGVHRVQPPAEAAQRHGYLDHVREIPLD